MRMEKGRERSGHTAAPDGLPDVQPPGAGKEAGAGRLAARALGMAATDVTSLYPFVLLFAVYALFADPLMLLAMVGLAYSAGAFAGMRQAERGGMRLVSAGLPALALAAGWLSFAGGGMLPAILGAAALAAFTLAGIVSGRKQTWLSPQPVVAMTGIGAAAIVALFMSGSGNPELAPHQTSLYALAMFAMFGSLLRWNAAQVQAASFAHAGDRAGLKRIAASGRRMTWLAIAAIALLAGWQGLGPLLRSLARSLLGLLPQGSGGPEQPLAPPQQTPMMPGLLPADEPSGPPRWLEIAGNALLVLLGLIAAVLVLTVLYRLVRRWLPERVRQAVTALLRRLRLLRELRAVPPEQGSYVDETERLEKVASRPRLQWLKRRSAARAEDAAAGDPRAAYRALLHGAAKRGFAVQASSTPSENGVKLTGAQAFTDLPPDELRRLIERYNAARYGGSADSRKG